MFFRYKARNYPETLSDIEYKKWLGFCYSRLSDDVNDGFIGFLDYEKKLSELKLQDGVDPSLVKVLREYAEELKIKLELK
jgi:exodeoxyribonuclease-1